MYKWLISLFLMSGFVQLTAFDDKAAVSFDEQYILNPEKALKELIPGTEDYFHYHCLFYQNKGDENNFSLFMDRWFKKFGDTGRYKEMLNRQALINYEKDPRKSLDHIIRELRLNYNYHKIAEERKIHYPDSLDQNLISWEKLSKVDVHYITDAGLELYSQNNMSWQNRRTLLGRISQPGFPNLVKLIIDDLNSEKAGTFGYIKIHNELTKEQLDECLKLMPSLINFESFVNAYILRLRPANHVNWEQNASHKEAYLNTLWDYVSTLSPSFNSLKAHVLLQKLNFERSKGKFDEDLFLEYLKLPRNVHYINHKYNNRKDLLKYRANLNANYSSVSGLGRVHIFENELVMDFFEDIFKKADDYKKFTEYVESGFLERTFAEVKILSGQGDVEKWYAKFKDSAYVKQLKERVELRILPQNIDYVTTENKTLISTAVKNIDKLIVKTYKINLYNYYKRFQKEVSTDLDLDGLVASNEKTFEYKQNPQIRHNEKFELDIKEPGVYIVELIGNGISSRALIRKGTFRFTETESSIGHVFNIYDEQNNPVKDAEIHLAGHVYKAEKDGFIRVPYTQSPGSQSIIIKRKDFSSLGSFIHKTESYELKAGFYINKESIIKNGTASLVIRPQLLLKGFKIPNSLLEDVQLQIVSTDFKGVSTTLTENNFKVFNTRESVYQLRIPEGVRSISYTLSGSIKKMSNGEKVALSSSAAVSLNSSYQTSAVADAYLRQSSDGYYIEVLGRTGEPVKQLGLNLRFNHKMLRNDISITLKTNDKGEVKLGSLKDISSINLSAGINRSWNLHDSVNLTPHTISVETAKNILIPFNWEAGEVSEQLTLLEIRSGKPAHDFTANISKKGAYLEISKLPEGQFLLYLKKDGRVLSINTLKGKEDKAYILADDRYMRQTYETSPVIKSIAKEGDGLKISLENFTANTRVHVFQTRFTPDDIPGLSLMNESRLKDGIYDFSRQQSQYLSERNIGDEYRYILTRRSGRLYPGNMLERPGLLLNPWVLRSTSTEILNAKTGGIYSGRSQAGRASSLSKFGGSKQSRGRHFNDLNFNFLTQGSRCYSNLAPDKDGIIKIENPGPGQIIHAVLVDGQNLQYKKSFVEDDAKPYNNLQMSLILDPAKHFVERKKISVLDKNKDFTLKSLSSAKVESYDSLRKVYTLLKTLNNDPKLSEFAFILDWPKLKAEEKLTFYSKYACHELNFFIFKKDPAFFNTIIVPYMNNKKGNTFLDHWLKNTAALKEFTQEWKYSRLNTVERILLAHRNKNLLIKREMQDNFDILNRDRNKWNFLFNSAVQNESLAVGNGNFTLKDKLNSEFKKRKGIAQSKLEERSEKSISLNRLNFESKKSDAKAPAAKEAMAVELDEEFEAAANDLADDGLVGGIENLQKYRNSAQQYYQEIGAVKEWVENNYYKLPIEQHVASLVEINAFWNDFAAHTEGAFISANIAEAAGNFTEMMYAISVLDLPFESGKIDSKIEDGKLVMKPENDLILFHREIEETPAVDSNLVLINQKFFDLRNRYRMEGNEKVEKYISEEFQTGQVYGARIIINNPSGRNRKLEVLTQIPEGAIPLNSSEETMSSLLNLNAYSTQTVEYYFYFPFKGKYRHFPVHISQEGELAGYVAPFSFNVVDEPTKIDKSTWNYISQNGTDVEVLQYLENNNLNRTDLSLTAWRMKNADFSQKVLKLLSKRNHFDSVSYSFALKHNIRNQASEYVKFSQFANDCGVYVSSPLLTVDPVERFNYQHREYSPLVNARVFQLGAKRKIVNLQFKEQYDDFMRYLTYKKNISPADQLVIVYYLLLQDRVEEGISLFQKIDRNSIDEKMQYDYMNAYVQFYLEEPEKAAVIATAYRDYPVEKWRKKFQQIISHAAEASVKANIERTTDTREGMQEHLASKEAVISFNIENGQVVGDVRNIEEVKVSYYLMDIELLFSRKPFIRSVSSDFAIIQPNAVEMQRVNDNKLVFNIPKELRQSNVMVEISGKGVSESKVYYANSMKVAVMSNYGILQVADPKNKPASKVYVKVYARKHNGQVVFHKDGYTDLRGKFDYSSVNTGNMEEISSFSFLVLSDQYGAMIKEAQPPKK